MSIMGTNFITEEATFEGGGVLYGIFWLKEDHYDHFQYYAATETLEELIEGFKNEKGMTELKYIPNVDIKSFKSDCCLSESALYENFDSAELMMQLTEIEKLDTVELDHIAGKGYKVYYYPKYLIYEITSMAVKIPKLVEYTNGTEPEWSFEYLIYPNFKVNEDVLQELRTITGKPLPINIEHNVVNFDAPTVFRPFSTSLYKFLYLKYFEQCGLSKGITNAIRAMEHNKVAQDTFYDIYQIFRANKKDYISYDGYEFYGPVKELKLNDYIEQAGLTPVEVGKISQNQELRADFYEKYSGKIMYEPIIAYIRNLSNSPFDAIAEYHEMEAERCYIRKMIYQLNMCWYDAFNPTLDYLNMVQPACNLNEHTIFATQKLTWVQGQRSWGISKKSYKPRRKK